MELKGPVIVDGKPQFGFFGEPVGSITHHAFHLKKPMGGLAGPLKRKFAFKHFQYIGAVSPDLFVGCAIAWLGFIANTFAYVFEPKSGRMIKRGFESLLGRGFEYNANPDDGHSRFTHARGKVAMGARPDIGKQLSVQIGNDFAIELCFEDAPPFEPMRICTQTAINGWTYAQKVSGVPAKGSVRCQLGEFDLAALGAYAHHDFTAGYLRRETFWHWASFSGRTETGDEVGLNLSCGVNETSFTENCLWHNGQLIKLAGTHFDFDSNDLQRPWQIRSSDGTVDLTFTPLGRYSTRRNLLISATDFQQLFGHFEGHIAAPGGPLQVQNIYGFCERQYAKW